MSTLFIRIVGHARLILNPLSHIMCFSKGKTGTFLRQENNMPHNDHITADTKFRFRWLLHPNCSPFGRATSHISNTISKARAAPNKCTPAHTHTPSPDLHRHEVPQFIARQLTDIPIPSLPLQVLNI